jgi:hypothetical protein
MMQRSHATIHPKNRDRFMKKFNLFKEIIVVARKDFMNAINSNKKFAITHEGKIEFEPFRTDDDSNF